MRQGWTGREEVKEWRKLQKGRDVGKLKDSFATLSISKAQSIGVKFGGGENLTQK